MCNDARPKTPSRRYVAMLCLIRDALETLRKFEGDHASRRSERECPCAICVKSRVIQAEARNWSFDRIVDAVHESEFWYDSSHTAN